MSTITVCYRNNFRLGSSKKYAVLSFKDDGIKIICTDEYPENFDTLVLALNIPSFGCNGCIRIR